jgi:hypothetical protein
MRHHQVLPSERATLVIRPAFSLEAGWKHKTIHAGETRERSELRITEAV